MIHRLILAACFAATSILPAAATPLRDLGKELSARHRDAVVWISVISRISMSADGDVPPQVATALAGQDREERDETTGTVVDPSGLIVAALGALDKSSMMDGQTINTPMGAIKLRASAQIKEVKIIIADGTEIPADLVLKDENLGLAFIKVRMDSDEAQGVEFKAIDLSDSTKGELLDACIALGRLDESLNREPSALTSEITGVTTRPRTFYRANIDALGCPVFLGDGKLLGISVVRKPSGSAAEGRTRLTPVVLPAADVARIAEQAKDAEPETTPQDEDSSGEANGHSDETPAEAPADD